MLLQGLALLVFHHHVDRVIGPEEVQHLDHVGMADARQGAAFLEKALHAIAEGGLLVARQGHHRAQLAAPHHAAGKIFLDGHRLAVGVEGQVDQGKPAAADPAIDDVLAQVIAVGQGFGQLGSHVAAG